MLSDVKQKMQASLDHLKGEIAKLHTGRANPGVIEDIQVEAYDSHMRLMEVATITAPQSNLLAVAAWDHSIIPSIVKAIEAANIGLNPQVDGEIIRLPIPPLSQERREQLVKLMHHELEEARVAIRQIRHEEREALLKAKRNGDISEDEEKRQEKELQDLTDTMIAEIDDIGQAKEQELMQV